MDNIEKMEALIGKRMPNELVDFDNLEKNNKSKSFKFEMESEYEFERNFDRIERASEYDSDDSEDEDKDEDDFDGFSEPISAQIFLTVYSDADGNVNGYDVSKYIDVDVRGMTADPDESEINDVLDLFLDLYEEDEIVQILNS